MLQPLCLLSYKLHLREIRVKMSAFSNFSLSHVAQCVVVHANRCMVAIKPESMPTNRASQNHIAIQQTSHAIILLRSHSHTVLAPCQEAARHVQLHACTTLEHTIELRGVPSQTVLTKTRQAKVMAIRMTMLKPMRPMS